MSLPVTVPIPPLNPQVVGYTSLEVGNEFRYLCVDGQYAYTVSGGWFLVVDISVPEAPVVVGSLSDNPGTISCGNIAKVGDYVLVTVQPGIGAGLSVIDVSNKADPTLVHYYTDTAFTGGLIDIAVSGRYAFVANGTTNSVVVIDITDLQNLAVVATLRDDTYLTDIGGLAVSGTYLWCAASTTHITAIDISNPLSPSRAGSIIAGGASRLVTSGRYVIAMQASATGIKIIDGADPTNPVLVSTLTDSRLAVILGVAVAGDYIYTVHQTEINNFNVVDWRNRGAPVVVASLSAPVLLSHAFSVVPAGRYAYCAVPGGFGTNGGFAVVDLGANEFATMRAAALSVGAAFVDDDLTVGGYLRVRHIISPDIPPPAAVTAGVATLVAGAVTVADTRIKSGSLIRQPSVLEAGGTQGDLSIARNAGTGFTISSTSALDTSSVFWEIVSY